MELRWIYRAALGLTIPDAIAFGSLCAAFLAALAGLLRGDRAGKAVTFTPEHQARPTLTRHEALSRLTSAITELAAAIRSATSADTAREQYTDMIHAMMRSIDEHDHSKKR